ncbi:MAG: hypothetical protein V2I46_08945 [Bacteroides sp.]|jgi:hypothetical protein|nr:hypothetical protein [Bacteroides sp.]
MRNLLINSLLPLFLLGFMPVFGQTELPADSLADKEPAHQFFAGAGYGSDLIYYGTSVSGNQPYFSGELIYAWEKGLWAAAAFYHLPEQEPFFSFVDLSVGYSYVFNKVFDAGLSVSQYHGGESIDTTFYADYTFLSASLGVDWRLLYTTFTPGWLLAEENSFYLVVDNTHYFRTPSFGKKDSYFTFNPGVSFLFGSYAWLRQYGGQGGGGQGPGPGGNRNTYATTVEEEDFRMLDMQLSIPVEFYLDRLSIEFEPAYFLNFIGDENGDTEGRFFFTLGFYYKIN